MDTRMGSIGTDAYTTSFFPAFDGGIPSSAKGLVAKIRVGCFRKGRDEQSEQMYVVFARWSRGMRGKRESKVGVRGYERTELTLFMLEGQ